MRPSRATGGGWLGRGVRQRRRIANGDGDGVSGLATEIPGLCQIAGRGSRDGSAKFGWGGLGGRAGAGCPREAPAKRS